MVKRGLRALKIPAIPVEFCPALESLRAKSEFRRAVVEPMPAEKDSRRYVASDLQELRHLYDELAKVSPGFAAIVFRYYERIRRGSSV